MLVIRGTVRLPAAKMEEARVAMRAMLAASRAEEGCIDYSYAEDVLDPGLIHISEMWTDMDALAAHGKSAHMTDWRRAGAELGIGERRLKLHEADEGKPI